jgi:hypothetical protein
LFIHRNRSAVELHDLNFFQTEKKRYSHLNFTSVAYMHFDVLLCILLDHPAISMLLVSSSCSQFQTRWIGYSSSYRDIGVFYRFF